MNTEITLKGVPLTRSGNSKRGFTSAAITLAACHNSSKTKISVKYMGCHIGYISHIHCSALLDGGVKLRGDISFPLPNLIKHREILNNKDVYPVCIIETASGANEARLSEVILLTEEERELDEQEPVNLKGLLNLVNLIAKSETPESVILFNKKYDNVNNESVDQVNYNESQGDTIRVISSFIPAIRKYSNDKRSLALVGRIIAVAGTSPNCRLHEIEAAYKEELEKIIDRFVRDWHEGFPTAC